MLPVGGVGLAGIGGACRLDVLARPVGQVSEMRRRLVLISRGGEGAVA
jgi:hypothetical protein